MTFWREWRRGRFLRWIPGARRPEAVLPQSSSNTFLSAKLARLRESGTAAEKTELIGAVHGSGKDTDELQPAASCWDASCNIPSGYNCVYVPNLAPLACAPRRRIAPASRSVRFLDSPVPLIFMQHSRLLPLPLHMYVLMRLCSFR